ncbi:cytochrome c551 [Pseudalkalibacillus berkeleyi]|uniref:Cytochrome c n=1 Tax=Pseudalkalibacillus berkeleyi TaxID=1069813 RepID=A0ABS9GX55_9BACL|nr:cytochrome c [Pseudalkalibacillus berkeleyi]MCF6136158.1 cytochrome c [Pseudalkalibacillus berkeleyi]
MMLRFLSFLALSFLLVIGLAACGGGEESEDSSNGNEETEQNGDQADGTVDVATAEKLYNKSCVGCHGQNLEGKSGPPLDKIGAKLSKDQILAKIKNGGGGMPKGLLKGEEAENVAAWLATMK